MLRKPVLALAALALASAPASAHHVMDGRMPASFADGLLSGLGHPVIGIDHFLAVLAVGCLAAAHRAGPALVAGFVLAMIAGAGVHLGDVSVPASEALVALSVVGLGALMLRREPLPVAAALAVFALAGLLHGYALGESIVGAERTPLVAYLAGLAVIQSAVALAAMKATRLIAQPRPVRIAGAAVAVAGVVLLALQLMPSA
ncbi:MAG: HupE/UreJ family protein [Pseudolabrys sp.]